MNIGLFGIRSHEGYGEQKSHQVLPETEGAIQVLPETEGAMEEAVFSDTHDVIDSLRDNEGAGVIEKLMESDKLMESGEHYDGTTFRELYPEAPRTADWDHSRGTVKNIPTRIFLQQVRECKGRIRLLERRKEYRLSAGHGTYDLDTDIYETEERLKSLMVTVADEISKIGNVNFETVLTMRYIDGKSWDEIAERMDLRIRTVLKFHGHGLVRMAEVLVRDGLIDPDDLNDRIENAPDDQMENATNDRIENTKNGQMENEREENAAE